MSHEAQSLVALWRSPIAAETPVGADARHTSQHETIRTEIAKLTDVAGGNVAWKTVAELGTALLVSSSKDLLIACYVSVALFEQHGLLGLAQGSFGVAALLQSFGKSLFPSRPRAQANALQWLVEHATSRLEAALSGARSETESVREALLALSQAARSVLEDDAPSFVPLERAVQRLLLSAQADEPSAEAPATAPEAPATAPEAPATAQPRKPPPLLQRPTQLPESHAVPEDQAQGPVFPELEGFLAPLQGASAAGTDCSYDDAFLAVRLEIDKLESLSATRPDYPQIVATCGTLLASRTKDLTVASYLAAALAETRGLEGALLGVQTYSGLIDRYWDTAFPPLARKKRRVSILGWLSERLLSSLSRLEVSADQTSLTLALQKASHDLDALVRQRFEDDAPSLRPLLQAAERLVLSVPVTPTTPKPEAAPIASSPATELSATPASRSASSQQSPQEGVNTQTPSVPNMVAPTAAEAPSGAASDAQVQQFLRDTREGLLSLSRGFFEQKNSDPRAYRYLRLGLWLDLSSVPPSNPEGRTRIAAPDRRARESLDRMLAGERWDAALLQCEGLARRNPVWLDVHYHTARCLNGLGAEFSEAKQAVEQEARALALRLPGLLNLKFADGSAVANRETCAWLKPAFAAGTESQNAEESDTSAIPASLAQASAEARAELDRSLRTSPPRKAFRLRWQLAQNLRAASQPEAALGLLLALEQDIAHFRLDEWEPELCLPVLSALLELAGAKESANRVNASDLQRICARLARLSPSSLLRTK